MKVIKEMWDELDYQGKKDYIEGFVGFALIFLMVWIGSVIGGA